MNLVYKQIFAGTFVDPTSYNTYIGGVSGTIGTAALLSAKIGVTVGNIHNFTVVGSDIKCKIIGNYTQTALCWGNNASITYYKDLDGLVLKMPSFFGCTAMTGKVEFINATSLDMSGGGYLTANTGITELVLPKVTSIGNYAFNNSSYAKNLMIVYIPLCTSLGSTSGDNLVFQYNNTLLKIYANTALQTNNGGSPDGDLTGRTVSYVANYTEPSAVTTLAAGTIYNTAIQLNFTPPSSTNAIDYYECYADGVFKNRITTSGGHILALMASTSYVITVIAVDVFFNKSLVSNSIMQSTNTTSAVPTTGLVSYYKLEANSNDSYGSNDGTDASVSYVSGKVSNAGSYNGTTSKTIIGNPANLQLSTGSISCWVKTSGAGSSYRCVFGKIDAYAMYLNTGVLVLYDWGSATERSTGINLNDGLWHHLVLVFDTGTNNDKVYVDGVLRLATTMTGVNQTNNVCIGSSNSIQNFNGTIDEASIYNTKLTQTEIDLVYNLGVGITL